MSSHELSVVAGQHYIVDDETGCWQWTGYKLRGYAWAGRPAHRMIYEQLVGPIPDGHDLHHGCHNRACVNPAHMQPLPTGLHRSAHKQARSPLTEADVVAIRHAAAAGVVLNDLAVKYAVHPNTIGAIVGGRNWATAGGPVGQPLRRCGFCGDEYRGHRLSRYCSIRCRQQFNSRKASSRENGRSDSLSLPSEACAWCSDSPDGVDLCPDCDRRAEEEGMAEMRAEEKERLREIGMA